ncbi:right-handed parallel beta-helix repeat-containing protein [Paenochrobactrum sp. BZR 201-1]
MSIFTKLGVSVAAPFNADGTPRQISPQDFQIWMTEIERLIKGLIAGAGGLELPELIYKYVITGGNENNIIAQPSATPPTAAGEALFTIEIAQANSGNVTINGKQLLTSSGNQISAGGLVSGVWLFLDDGENFRLVSDQASQSIVSEAELASQASLVAQMGAEAALAAVENLASDVVSQGNVPIYSTLPSIETLEIPAGITAIRVNGRDAVGDGEDHLYKRVSEEPEHAGKVQSANGIWFEDPFFVDFTVYIPSDYLTIQSAIDALSRKQIRQGSHIVIMIESGHKIEKGIVVANGDFSKFVIKSEDAVMELSSQFDVNEHLLEGKNARIPVLSALVDMNGFGKSGMDLRNGCVGMIMPGAGFKNARVYTLDIHCSNLDAIETIFDGCIGTRNIHVTHGATVNLLRSTVRNSLNTALYASHGGKIAAYGVLIENTQGYAALEATGAASIEAFQAVIKNSAQNAIYARTAGTINVSNAEVHSADYGVRAFSGSSISASGVKLIDCNYGVSAQNSSFIDVQNSELNGCTFNALSASYCSSINASGAKCNDAGGDAVLANYSSDIDISGGEAKNSGGIGGHARRGSRIVGINTDFSGATTYGVLIREGSTASILGANCRRGVVDVGGDNADIRAAVGGIISCNSSTVGGLSVEKNTLSVDGIIFQP